MELESARGCLNYLLIDLYSVCKCGIIKSWIQSMNCTVITNQAKAFFNHYFSCLLYGWGGGLGMYWNSRSLINIMSSNKTTK